ncbi:bifunctional DNA-binding transcriptional regulator/O6-methylguanine-DNA methyltransferase Ada [Siccirubricoccus phaeus]|uniref:bifunctional DNA-binding transcriptional regulator/O6-methylguanine-DNA methyltransferase Ada n=1 Tax=Siccirubricoccus phaeus TaxID=2595053 RepID=UPI0011F0CC77|nr:bifunctional DNA-binding transcriptional regulator/O6-methylguanine-DNA methyltransferase Ada [Siccirubricoccus phaeus]
MPDTQSIPDPEAARWDAVLARDPSPACGPFLYAVTTQGVFCRPGCPSRPPLRRNTRFFADAAAAEAAGFRACRRCDPKGERAALHAAAIRAACDLIEASESLPGLAALADRAGYARHHFLRLFKEITGVTPHSYGQSVKARRLQAALAAGDRVAEAVAGAGYGSESRVYGAPGQVLGMTPGAARRGGAGEVICTATAMSALGPLMVGATERGICFIGFAEGFEALEGDLRQRFPEARVEPAPEALAEAVREVVAFLEEPKAALALPLDLRGTAFQRRVWEALQAIPFGETRTYSDVAQSIGAPRAVRAVARACAQNHVSLAVPCHRVIGRDGDLTGYRWGVPRKRALLAKERAGAGKG